MNTDHPSPASTASLRALWKEAFGDSDAFLDTFFAVGFSPERCRCIRQEDRVVSALYWFDFFCQDRKFAYIYAVATAASARGKGHCACLMAETADHLRAAGYHGAMLVPQNPALRSMYGRMGYRPGTKLDEFFCASGSASPVRQICAAEFAALRREYAPENSPVPGDEALAFLETQADFFTGDGYLAAVSRETDRMRILEFLGDRSQIPGFIAGSGHAGATVRTPGNNTDFSMYLPLMPDCPIPGHFPFAFD